MTELALERSAADLQGELLVQLRDARRDAGLTQFDLALRTGLNRMTVQRAEAADGGAALGTFVRTALALGLTPTLLPSAQVPAANAGAVVDRETALAAAWQAANDPDGAGLAPVLDALLPGHDAAQAKAVATVVQWLGTDIGFAFLRKALAQAGYDITPRTPA